MGIPIDSSLETWLEASVEHVQRVKRAKRLGKERSVSNIVKHSETSSELATWEAMREQADALVKSGFLPKAVNTPEKAMAIIQTGRELGLGPMQSLRSIHIIEGKPTMSADLIAGLALSKVPGSVLRVAESTNMRCVVQACRAGQGPTTFTYTMEDAKNAGLTGKQNWRNYPRAMLRARAITEAARAIFPDAVVGLYDPDELGAVTTPDGAVVELREQHHGQELHHEGTALPGDDPTPRQNDVYDRCMATLADIEQRLKSTERITYEELLQIRERMGKRGGPQVQMVKDMSELNRGDAISPGQKKELGKVWNRIDRQVTRFEGITQAPPVEASFEEPESEREPGEDDL